MCELFLPDEKQWDSNKVHNLFSNCDAEAILAIPIPKAQVIDHIAWICTVDGNYSVKSGYNYWYKRHSECRWDSPSKGWSKLWKLEVPHKVRLFLWRLCRNNIPVRNVLKGRGVRITIMCPNCMVDVEHLLHTFFDCRFAQECWRVVGLQFDTSGVEDLPGWLLQRLEVETQDMLIQIAKVLWGIWSARNLLVWENKALTPEVAMQ